MAMLMAAHPFHERHVRPRMRAWKPKSTTGCITCKVRRVKCDEAKPYCHRCNSTGRRCDGYASPSRSPTSPSSTSSTSVSGTVPVRQPSSVRFSLAEEGESFDFFLNYAVRDLCGFFDSPFWQRELLQAAQYHAAIRHGVIAVGAMHRRYVSGNDADTADNVSDKQLRFALKHSNRAIQELMKKSQPSKTSETDVKTIMTCCVLFSTLACLQGEQKEAMNHICCGIRLMKELVATEAAIPEMQTHPVSLQSLCKIFMSLNVQALSIMSADDLLHWETIPSGWLDSPVFSNPWVSLDCAQHYFEMLLANVLAFLQGGMDMPPIDDPNAPDSSSTGLVFSKLRQRFQTGIVRLHTTFPEVFSNNTTDPGSVSVRLICAQIELFLMIFSTIGEEPGGRFDDDGPFNAMMDLICRLRDSYVQGPDFVGSVPRRPVYSSTNGPLSTLFLVATRAPSVKLRKRSIWIMMNNPRRDGLWDGPWAGKIAQEALALEEMTARDEMGIDVEKTTVPSKLRIRDISISYPLARQAIVEFRNERAIERAEPGWIRHINW